MSAVTDFAPLTRSSLSVVGADLPVPTSGGYVSYANLDYAASAPCLEAVRDAVDTALPYYSSVHRGAGYASQVTTDRYERARQTVRSFVGAWRRDAVVFTRNTTDAMNLLAHALPAGTSTVVFESEHHATLLPWKRATRLPVPESPVAAVAAAAAALAQSPAGPRLLVVTAASNVTGELWPIAELAATARAHGARIAVDAAQLVPHRPFDMGALDIDYVAFSGHKLYAPFGAGCLVGRADWLRAAEPYLLGGGATADVGDDHVTWSADPEQRHEAGTPNVLGTVALAAACEALDGTGWDGLVAEEERLLAKLRAGLARIPGIRVLGLWDDDHPRVGIVSFVAAGWASRDLAAALSDQYGIGVRDGRFCAHRFVRRLLTTTTSKVSNHGPAGGGQNEHSVDVDNVDCSSATETAVRASIGIGTTDEHIERLLNALRRLV